MQVPYGLRRPRTITMDGTDHCRGCGNEFRKVGKNFGRRSIVSISSPRTATSILGTDNGYICVECETSFREKTVWKRSSRKRTLPVPPATEAAPKKKLSEIPTMDEMSTSDAVARCVANFKAGYYRRGLEVLVNNSVAARRALLQVHAAIVKKEVRCHNLSKLCIVWLFYFEMKMKSVVGKSYQ